MMNRYRCEDSAYNSAFGVFAVATVFLRDSPKPHKKLKILQVICKQRPIPSSRKAGGS